VDPPSPVDTEIFEAEMAQLEAATSSFVLDDTTQLQISSPVGSPLTRSKRASSIKTVAQDPVLAMYTKDYEIDPFAENYVI
jgi:hypothetical protein